MSLKNLDNIVDWNSVQNKPNSFPSSWDDVAGKPESFGGRSFYSQNNLAIDGTNGTTFLCSLTSTSQLSFANFIPGELYEIIINPSNTLSIVLPTTNCFSENGEYVIRVDAGKKIKIQVIYDGNNYYTNKVIELEATDTTKQQYLFIRINNYGYNYFVRVALTSNTQQWLNNSWGDPIIASENLGLLIVKGSNYLFDISTNAMVPSMPALTINDGCFSEDETKLIVCGSFGVSVIDIVNKVEIAGYPTYGLTRAVCVKDDIVYLFSDDANRLLAFNLTTKATVDLGINITETSFSFTSNYRSTIGFFNDGNTLFIGMGRYFNEYIIVNVSGQSYTYYSGSKTTNEEQGTDYAFHKRSNKFISNRKNSTSYINLVSQSGSFSAPSLANSSWKIFLEIDGDENIILSSTSSGYITRYYDPVANSYGVSSLYPSFVDFWRNPSCRGVVTNFLKNN